MTKKQENKPLIETMLNQSAIVLTATGTVMLVAQNAFGLVLIGTRTVLELVKYWGRRKYW